MNEPLTQIERLNVERLSVEKLAKHFDVTPERAQAAINDLGFLYRELASLPAGDRTEP